jgi:hypothetical protein
MVRFMRQDKMPRGINSTAITMMAPLIISL